MFASFASCDGRAVLVSGLAANSTTSIIVTLDDHPVGNLQTFVIIELSCFVGMTVIVVVAHRKDLSISFLALGAFLKCYVGLRQIVMF